MNWEIENYRNILLLSLIPVLILLLFYFNKWRKNKQMLFAEKKFHPMLFEKKSFFSKIFPLLYILAILSLVLSLIGFISKEKDSDVFYQKSNNIIFLIDVSKSMNAQDIEPSRLEQSKKIIIQSLKNLTDENIGIVAFAGEARSIMPLTTDYSSANIYLSGISSNIIQKQGTDFLLAIKESIKKFKYAHSDAKKIILISDGEDNEDNFNLAIQEANKNKISITAVGVGTEQGAPIPELIFNYYENYKRDENGQIIISKKETSSLKTISKQTNGVYIDGNNVEDAVKHIIKNIQTTNQSLSKKHHTILKTTYHYQWFVGISVLLFFLIYLFNPKKDLEF